MGRTGIGVQAVVWTESGKRSEWQERGHMGMLAVPAASFPAFPPWASWSRSPSFFTDVRPGVQTQILSTH